MRGRSVIIIQVRNPVGKEEPLPVLRVFDDVKMLKLKRAFFTDTLAQVAAVEFADVKVAIAPRERAIWARDAAALLREHYPQRRGVESLASRMEVLPQSVASIGERTTENLRHCLSAGYQYIITMGGYLPTMPPELIVGALEHLRDHPLILGPTIEGGCYLFGMRSDCPEAAGLVTIGSDQAYRDSTGALERAGLTWQEIDLNYDVSHQEDLEFIVREINFCRINGDEDTGRCTEDVLAEYIKESPAEP